MCAFIAPLQRRPRCVCCADKKKNKKDENKEGREGNKGRTAEGEEKKMKEERRNGFFSNDHLLVPNSGVDHRLGF